MKKLFNLMAVILPLCACAGVSSFDGNSTKQWIVIDSSKQDLEGKTIDVCYRLDVRFSPQEATQRFDTDKACMTRCCWYSQTKSIILNLNTDFAKELAQNESANKYTLDTLTFNIRYSNLLDTIHASVKPSSVMRSDGLISLDYTKVNNDSGLLKVDLGDFKPYDYSNEADGHKGQYLFKDQEAAMQEHEQAINELKELSEYQKVDTGLTPGEVPVEKAAPPAKQEALVLTEEVVLPNQQKTIIGTLQTQADKEAAQKALQEQIAKEEAQKTLQAQVAREEAQKTLQAQVAREEAQKTLQAQNQKLEQEIEKTENVFFSTEVYNLNDPAQRQELLEKKLAYERSQAVALLKQFYEQDIDAYIRHLDKKEAKKGYVLLANDREWQTTKIGYPIYKVKCSVKGKLGKTQNSMKDYPIPCGIYEVNLDKKSVLPRDVNAITIINKDYIY